MNIASEEGGGGGAGGENVWVGKGDEYLGTKRKKDELKIEIV